MWSENEDLVLGEDTLPSHAPPLGSAAQPQPSLPQGIKQGFSQGLRGLLFGPTFSCVNSSTVQVPIGFSPK